MKEFDYIITGSGASGLMLAYRMANDSFFEDKTILIIDKEKKKSNDRTWCFWEEGKGEWDAILCKVWSEIIFESPFYSTKTSIAPYEYKMIRSADFYQLMWKTIEAKSNFSFVSDTVLNISHKSNSASVLTEKTSYSAQKIFNSIAFNANYQQQKKYPVLKQHFIGWFVETKDVMFDDSKATFMDFTVQQKRKTRFMYILPISPRKALFEYTLFSARLLSEVEYEKEIVQYLEEKGITDYKIVEKEKGMIPMTAYKFWKHNSKNVLNIGTVGGWSKASTGYTFMNITRKTREVIEFLKTEKNLREFHKSGRFWWYDLLLLDVLSKYNHQGARLFSTLFQKNRVQKVFRFLDEKTTFFEDVKIMWSMPSWKFTRALFKRIL